MRLITGARPLTEPSPFERHIAMFPHVSNRRRAARLRFIYAIWQDKPAAARAALHQLHAINQEERGS